jgi:hypothetical protein
MICAYPRYEDPLGEKCDILKIVCKAKGFLEI